MTNKTLTKLRQAIIKEIPEIVELKMGCFVEVEKNSGEKEILSYRNKTTLIKRDDIFRTDGCGCCSINYSEEKVKIIGRKITLADILSIVEMMYEDDKNKNAIPTSEIPEIKQVLNCWRFSRGDLENQSKLTINSLSKIILKGDE